jgi:hypothetical protein
MCVLHIIVPIISLFSFLLVVLSGAVRKDENEAERG